MPILPLQAIITAIIFETRKLLRFWGDELTLSVGRKDRCILQLVCTKAYRGTFSSLQETGRYLLLSAVEPWSSSI
jgi:hypothetical protein